MTKKPNLIFIFSDQQRQDTMECYGNDWIKTPNINELATRSFVFKNAYVTQPVCTPSRASIMTGLYPHAAGPVLNGIELSNDVQSIAEMISTEYTCGYFGKWHLGHGDTAQHGFSKWVSTEDGYEGKFVRGGPISKLSDYHQHLVDNGFCPDKTGGKVDTFTHNNLVSFPAKYQMAPYLGDRAAEFIEENKEQPFVMYVSCIEPHSPYIGSMQDTYDPEQLPVGPTFLKKPDNVSLLNRLKAEYYLQYMEGGDPDQDAYMSTWAAVGEDVTTEAGWRQLRAHYYGTVSLVDAMVGKITDAIEHAGLINDTIIVFTSDHGDLLGDHGMLEKRSFYEESARVPLLISIPALSTSQTQVEGSFSQIDLVPTLLNLLGQDIPAHLHGESRIEVLHGTDSLHENNVVVEWNGIREGHFDRSQATLEIDRMNHSMWRSIIHDRWKLNLCSGDQNELFDLNNDPYEEINLFNNPEHKDRVRDMAAKLRVWQNRTGDIVPLPDL